MNHCAAILGVAVIVAGANAEITLVPAGSIDLGGPVYPTRAAAADIDSNGTIDLVVSCRDIEGRMLVIRGLAGGGFMAPEALAVGVQTDWVEIRDVDGDSLVDLVVSMRPGYGRLAVLRGLGGGAFAAPLEFLAQRNPAGLELADFDGDGDADAALVNWGSGSLEIFRNDGALSFSRTQTIRLQPWAVAIPYPFSIASDDFDGDGDIDIATCSIGTKSIAIHRNNGAGNFSQPRSWTTPSVNGEAVAISNIISVDIDRDGDRDLVSNGLLLNSPQCTIIWRNDGAGGFADRVIAAGVPTGNSWAIASADLDLDGDGDLLMGSALPGNLTVAEVDGAAGGTIIAMANFLGGGFTREITPVDIDADGDIDVVTTDISSHKLFLYKNMLGGVAGGLAGGWASSSDVISIPPKGDATERIGWLARWTGPEGGIAGSIPPACGPGAAPCEEPHATPGCVRTLCCEAVCEFNPLCCEVEWDQACVDAEDQLCDALTCPSAGGCEEFHVNPGCDDEACCLFLCEFDPFCCDPLWDEICARESAALCGLSACDLAPDPTAIVLAELCYERKDEGCNRNPVEFNLPVCGGRYEATIASDAPRDTDWFALGQLTCPGARISIDTEFPLQALALRGPCEGPLEVVAEVVLLPCAQGSLDIAPLSADWLVISAANHDRPLRQGLPCDLVDPNDPPPNPDDPPFVPGYFGLNYRVGFAPLPLQGDINGDGHVDGLDLTAMLSGWGQPGPADLDGNGIVDGLDLTALLSNWS